MISHHEKEKKHITIDIFGVKAMLKEYKFSSYVDNSGGIKLAVLKILATLSINTTFPHDQLSSQALGTAL